MRDYTLTIVFHSGEVVTRRRAGPSAREVALAELVGWHRAATVTATDALNQDVYIAQRDRDGRAV